MFLSVSVSIERMSLSPSRGCLFFLVLRLLRPSGVMLTALQLSQLNLLVNGGCYLWSRLGTGRIARILGGVSWMGHLGGIAAGCLFAAYKRHFCQDPRWGSFRNLSRTFSASDWYACLLLLLLLLMVLLLLLLVGGRC